MAYGGAGVRKSVGFGKFGSYWASFSELFTAIAKQAKHSLDQFNAQELVNTAWALATVGQKDELLFNALTIMAEQRLDQFNAQDFANTAWALTDSTVRYRVDIANF